MPDDFERVTCLSFVGLLIVRSVFCWYVMGRQVAPVPKVEKVLLSFSGWLRMLNLLSGFQAISD